MSKTRNLSSEEKDLLTALLRSNAKTAQFISTLDDLLVREMPDGGMGSLSLIPKGMEEASGLSAASWQVPAWGTGV